MSKSEIYAHTREGVREKDWQTLDEHLSNAADLAEKFASIFGAEELGRLLGLCHDAGKANPKWQKYLRGKAGGTDHKAAGAVLICEKGGRGLELLSLASLGHHGGMPAKNEVATLIKNSKADRGVNEAVRLLSGGVPECRKVPDFLKEGTRWEKGRRWDLFLRMLFSCLVDADYLDTERYMSPGRSVVRGSNVDLTEMQNRLKRSQAALDSSGLLNLSRQEVYESVVRRSDLPPGLFSMNIPTGGGKTRTGMGFALGHAIAHGMQRVIVVVPYRSIIEQTARTYREIFGADAVVEHHSGIDPKRESYWNRLSSENWDAPIIVTTSVQFFDSLHSNMPSRCRKLHNIARSVVILDEVQTLPPELLSPTLDVIRELVEHYGVSFVFSTATQPAFTDRPGFTGLTGVRELAPGAFPLFRGLCKVNYEFPAEGEAITLSDLARRISRKDQAMVVVNTKKVASRLYGLLSGTDTFHLSGNMCPAHRKKVLKEVEDRLERGLPCLLVSTQVVESGVDISFPVVYREVGPLDSIVQVAGRCNREGEQAAGRLIVVRLKNSKVPPGAYRSATALTELLMPELTTEKMRSPKLFQDYFRRLYDVRNTDKSEVLESRENLDFPETASRFRLINSDTRTVIVPWGGGVGLADEMRQKEYLNRQDFRQIQTVSVSLRPWKLQQAVKDGLCEEVRDGLYEWTGEYDDDVGIVMASPSPDKLIC